MNTIVQYKFENSEKVSIRRKPLSLLPGDDADAVKMKIGSSFKHGSVLRGVTPQEEAVYLPELIGSDPLKQDWAIKTKEYWQNISVEIPAGNGKELEIGFKYPTKEKVQTIGGFLVIMYAPIFIGLIWFDTELMLKIIMTNAVLIFFVWIFDRSL